MKSLNAFVGCNFIILVLGMSGCLKQESVAPKNYAGVSFYHSSPDAPDVNIIVDNVVINTGAFKYKNYSNYIDVEAGDRRIKFNSYSNGVTLADSSLSFEAGKVYSLFMMNVVSKKIQLLKAQDVGDFPPAGSTMIRFVHLSPDAPSVEIRWQGESSPLFSGNVFKTITAYQQVIAKTYTMEVKVIGGSGTTLVVPDIQISEGTFYSILLEGFDTPPSGNTNKLSARVVTN